MHLTGVGGATGGIARVDVPTVLSSCGEIDGVAGGGDGGVDDENVGGHVTDGESVASGARGGVPTKGYGAAGKGWSETVGRTGRWIVWRWRDGDGTWSLEMHWAGVGGTTRGVAGIDIPTVLTARG